MHVKVFSNAVSNGRACTIWHQTNCKNTTCCHPGPSVQLLHLQPVAQMKLQPDAFALPAPSSARSTKLNIWGPLATLCFMSCSLACSWSQPARPPCNLSCNVAICSLYPLFSFSSLLCLHWWPSPCSQGSSTCRHMQA